MLKEKLSIDDKDVLLLTKLMHNPEISQSELATLLKISQPSVNVRVRKLKNRGILAHSVGIDAHKAGVSMVRVDFTCSRAEKLLSVLKQCSFFVNGFLMSGTRNVSVFLIGEDLKKIELIISQYLRSTTYVANVEVSVVVDTAKEFICSIDLEREHSSPCSDPKSCKDCDIVHKFTNS